MSASDQDQSQPSQSIKESSSQIQSQDHAVQTHPENEAHPAGGASATSTTAAAAPEANPATTQLSQQQRPQEITEESQPPASPPLPQKHTPATPGPRAGRFIQLYDGALASTLRKVNYDNFASCFPTVAAHAPNTLRNVQKQMVDYLEERCNKDFQSILADRDVIRKLNELENLVSDAERRRQEGGDVEEPTPPHVLPPDEILTAHLAPRLAPQQSTLNARLQNTQASNESLFISIQSQRAEIDALLAQLESQVTDIDGANALLVDVASELAAEARASEVEMAGM
ncbi:Nnf1-domain-containing protein [Colletotrichum phormii]|uniref:Nnf1-domain-containing protein n=1 Tax=Colletotrichum phormii TaxID=359342 RepID=A0AAJ0EHL5_9PEZI|nr:Nnf1-domain-containing protein [Colletotrichum phormii]KAK1637166.1 Nnf1-domain-containing protein [Colletotrichum phormii]